MSYITDRLTFTVPLTSEAYQLAEKFCNQHKNTQKARQVYLNVLAVYAVTFYCQCMGIDTDLQASDSFDLTTQSFMDISDLEVKNLGKLECRPVLPDVQACYIPPEARENRIGYVVVEINESLREATLLGFAPPVDPLEMADQLLVSKLQPLDYLFDYLEQLESGNNVEYLKQWLEGIFKQDWQPKEAVLASSRRSADRTGEVSRAKLLELGEHIVALLVSVISESSDEFNIQLRLYPAGRAIYLPPGTELIALDDSGEIISETQAEEADNWIQIELEGGEPGDRFSVKVALGDISITEHFGI